MSKNEKETLLLVGGSSDLGLAIAREFRGEGLAILAHHSRSLAKINALKKDLPGEDIVPMKADLAKAAEAEALAAAVKRRCGAPDKLVLLAAPKARSVYFRNASWDDFQSELDIQLRSTALILRELLPAMAERRKGKIVFVLSSFVLGTPPQATAHYTTAKYALLGLMKVLAAEYVKHGVTVNAVSPAMMRTAFLENMPERMVEIAAAQTPLGRLAETGDVAPLVKFLLSPQAGYITGANVPVAGGTAF